MIVKSYSGGAIFDDYRMCLVGGCGLHLFASTAIIKKVASIRFVLGSMQRGGYLHWVNVII